MFELLLGCSQKEVSMLGLASGNLGICILCICQLYVHEQKKTQSCPRSVRSVSTFLSRSDVEVMLSKLMLA